MLINPPTVPIPEGFSFRSGKNTDAAAIQCVVFTVLKEHGLIPEPNATDSDLSTVEDAYADGFFGVIQNENGEIVSTFGLLPLTDTVVEIRKMYATSGVRGKGLGKWMVSYLLQIAKENGYRNVELETASPLIAAIALYKKMGFQEKTFDNKTKRCDQSFVYNI